MQRRKAISLLGILPAVQFLPAIFYRSDSSDHCRPFIIEAHRGNSIAAPENTMEAIEQAILLKVDRIEIDLEFSRDGKPVIIHDKTVDRTTSGTGPVSEKNWSDLKKLDAGSWKSERYRNARIPLLSDVLDLCKGKTMVNIDLKNENAVSEMVRIVKKMKMENQVVITGLIPKCTEMIRSAGSRLTMFYESTPEFDALFQQGRYYDCIELATVEARLSLLPGFLFTAGFISCEIVHVARMHGLAVNVYDVNTSESVKSMVNAGVDALMTDDPLMVMTTWKEMNNTL